VSTPRRTVGTSSAGRLPAAMLRALAAELSDPGRFSRAKAYARDGAVVDIDVQPGAARGLVQGSRYEPYAVTLHTEPARDGEGLLGLIPERAELFLECTCPDAETFGACKHGLAVLLVLADEISIEPAVLERWRVADAGSGAAARRDDGDVTSDEPDADVLAEAMAAPAPLPELPAIPPRVPIPMPATPGTRDADVSAALASAITVLRAG
jgi:uncharacterized Zn finger protein